MLVPKLCTTLKSYTKEQFGKDFAAGIIVAIIALPLSIALAIASGLSPEKGLYTAIIGGLIISLLGGSRVQIGGPAGAFVIIVYGIVQQFGVNGLLLATLMSGLLLIAMGLLRFGNLIKYIPTAITNGFGSGIAIIILSTQIKDFFGLSIQKVPSEFLEKMVVFGEHMKSFRWESLLIGLLSLGIIILWPKATKKIPGTLIAIVVATIVTMAAGLDVPTIGSQFADLSNKLPLPAFPEISLDLIRQLAIPAVTLAVLGSVESLLSAVVADGMIGSRHRSNMELIAQGLANMSSAFFGGMPVTGAIARTTANIQNGGRTPIAGVVHSLALLLMLILLMPFVKLVPMASLAGVLIMVSYNMGDWGAFKHLNKAPKSDSLVFLATFVLTILLDVVVAIGIGVVLASLLFMKKMADLTEVGTVTGEEESHIMEHLMMPEHVSFYEINGPFFFGAADKFVKTITQRETKEHVLIIKMSDVPFMDATAFDSFDRLLDTTIKKGIKIVLLGIQEQPYALLDKYGFLPKFGLENFCKTTKEAIDRANQILQDKT